MLAMMPLVSQAPRPQMKSSSSREEKKGGNDEWDRHAAERDERLSKAQDPGRDEHRT